MIIELNSNIDIIDGEDERLVIGFFDGIHHGHMSLFSEDTSTTSVLTFVNVPNKNDRLYSDRERFSQLEKIGVKNIYVFDIQDNITSSEFIDRYLKKIAPNKIVVGDDFKFGSDQASWKVLEQDFEVEAHERVANISTTNIKHYIKMGDLERANTLLLWPYYRKGVVAPGHQVSRELSTKTANIPINTSLIKMSQGIYATKTRLDNEWYKSVSLVGRPKSHKLHSEPRIETHLIDYNSEDFYNEQIKVVFYKKIGSIRRCLFKSSLIKRIKKMIAIASDYVWLKKENRL